MSLDTYNEQSLFLFVCTFLSVPKDVCVWFLIYIDQEEKKNIRVGFFFTIPVHPLLLFPFSFYFLQFLHVDGFFPSNVLLLCTQLSTQKGEEVARSLSKRILLHSQDVSSA